MKYALIIDGEVREIFEKIHITTKDKNKKIKKNLFHEDVMKQIEEVEDSIEIGYIKDGKNFIPAPEPSYKEKRIIEYPNIGDQLDALWKQLNYMRLNGENLIQEADDMLGDILSVKARHPKT